MEKVRRKKKKKQTQAALHAPIVAQDIRRGEVGRKNIMKLFQQVVEADWLAFADNPLFDRDRLLCRSPETW